MPGRATKSRPNLGQAVNLLNASRPGTRERRPTDKYQNMVSSEKQKAKQSQDRARRSLLRQRQAQEEANDFRDLGDLPPESEDDDDIQGLPGSFSVKSTSPVEQRAKAARLSHSRRPVTMDSENEVAGSLSQGHRHAVMRSQSQSQHSFDPSAKIPSVKSVSFCGSHGERRLVRRAEQGLGEEAKRKSLKKRTSVVPPSQVPPAHNFEPDDGPASSPCNEDVQGPTDDDDSELASRTPASVRHSSVIHSPPGTPSHRRSVPRSPAAIRRRSVSRSPAAVHRSVCRSPLATCHRSVSRSPTAARRHSRSHSPDASRRHLLFYSPVAIRRRSRSRSPVAASAGQGRRHSSKSPHQRPNSPTSRRRRSRSPLTTRDASHVTKRRRVQGSGTRGRLRMQDFKSLVRSVLKDAIGHYRTRLSTEDPYPADTTQEQWAKAAWVKACQNKGVDIPVEEEIIGMITARGSQLRGEIKTKTRPLVESAYELQAPADQKDMIKNRDWVASLLTRVGFVYRYPKERLQIYEHPVLQSIINAVWFQNPKDEGVKYGEYFGRRIPLPTLALVMTAIENVLDEWRTGEHQEIRFTEGTYKEKYEKNLEELENFQQKTRQAKILPTLRAELLQHARAKARAPMHASDVHGPSLVDDDVMKAIQDWMSRRGGDVEDDGVGDECGADMEVEEGGVENDGVVEGGQ